MRRTVIFDKCIQVLFPPEPPIKVFFRRMITLIFISLALLYLSFMGWMFWELLLK
jgi:hypothetical protein